MNRTQYSSLIFIVLIAVAGCTREYNQELCGTYRLVRPNVSEVAVCFKDVGYEAGTMKVVAANVTKVAVKAPYITGYSTDLAGGQADIESGYFLIDTRTNQRDQGMTEQQWKDKMKFIGWQKPSLERPK